MGDHDAVHSALPLLLVGTILGYSMVPDWGRANVTAPMVFVAVGALAGNTGLGLVPMAPDAHRLLAVAEITLDLLLVSDASHLRLGEICGDPRPAVRCCSSVWIS